MQQYHDFLRHILHHGFRKEDRTGTGTLSTFVPPQMRFDLSQGFPLLTTKKLHWKSIAVELLFFITGKTNQKYLLDQGVTIWQEWGDANGNLGPVYSHQWRNFGGQHENRPQPKPQLEEDYEPTVCGVASQGSYVNDSESLYKEAFQIWKGMINRCYNSDKDTYAYYGGRGVHVCDRWLLFTNFLEDTVELPGWHDKLNNWPEYNLDKDIIGDGFRYSPDTCIWASKSDNMRNAKNNIIYYLEHDDGRKAEVRYPKEFYTQEKIAQGNFCSMLRGDRPRAGGWRLLGSKDPTRGVDQLQWVIDEIKRNPDSRRLIVSAWNPSDLPYMALPPCHMIFQFYVIHGKLSCHLYQRSADAFLGVPFNIASYALLTHIIARLTDLEPGELIMTFGDAHIYLNHRDQVHLQLSREPRALPTLWINPRPFTLEDLAYEDFRIQGYEPYAAIRAQVAV